MDTSTTFLDSMCKFIANNVDEDMTQFMEYIECNLYDSDAIRQDLDGFNASSPISTSNIYDKNKKCGEPLFFFDTDSLASLLIN